VFFWERKILGHKADKPCMITVVQHLQDLWIGMGKVIDNENWSVASPKIKILSNLIQAYARRTSSQAERQLNLISQENPARNVEKASNVGIVEILPLNATLPANLCTLDRELQDRDVYVPMDVNTFMKGFSGWLRLLNMSVAVAFGGF
jgi:hypothetical protein